MVLSLSSLSLLLNLRCDLSVLEVSLVKYRSPAVCDASRSFVRTLLGRLPTRRRPHRSPEPADLDRRTDDTPYRPQHAYDRGLSRDEIQRLGRWTSDALDRYFTKDTSRTLRSQRKFNRRLSEESDNTIGA
ncbi:hypothetical protein E4U38_004974 [Claviceps purpurea]|nr:hypothetical protein E4U38_004974 [Claviceps purpurea]